MVDERNALAERNDSGTADGRNNVAGRHGPFPRVRLCVCVFLCVSSSLSFFRTLYSVQSNTKLMQTRDGINWSIAGLVLNTYNNDVSVFYNSSSSSVGYVVVGGNNAYVCVNSGFPDSTLCVPRGGGRTMGGGFPTIYNNSVNEVRGAAGRGFWELTDGPLPTQVTLDAAVMTKFLDIKNATSILFNKTGGLYLDAVNSMVSLRDNSVVNFTASNSKFVGSGLAVQTGSKFYGYYVSLINGSLVIDDTAVIVCYGVSLSNVALNLTIRSQPSSGPIVVTVASLTVGVAGSFSSITVQYNLMTGQNVQVSSRGAPVPTYTA